MGKKGYNWKARQVLNTVIDDSKSKKIQVEFTNEKEKYDESNALVLPSEKRKTKIKHDKQQVTRILSKKQRKHLEKIVEKKKKKENRASLLESLSEVQASPEELNQLTLLASVQTKGLRKHFKEENNASKPKRKYEEVVNNVKINSISGSKRKRITLTDNKDSANDPNVVTFEQSDSEDSEISDEDTQEVENNNDISKEESDMFKNIENDDGSNQSSKKNKDKTETEHLKNDELNQTNEEVKNGNNSLDNKNKNILNKTPKERKPAIFVPVDRKSEVQKNRLKLPILAEEQQIMETVNENPVILIAGETGSGKTTQVPQFLYEAGYALNKMIAVTEPRRVAAIAMSKRVAEEMSLSSDEVSYLIRFEGNTTDKTKVKFMTDGVLLKELQSDFVLSKYSVVILDEAHERSVFTDILIGLLSRIVPLRNKKGDPLKLIIMSATLRLEDFTKNKRLFKIKPPVIKVDARQFPVTIHFNRKTADNYLKQAFNKAVKVHTKLPDGGILIFVTGQQEVKWLVRRLRKSFPLKHKQKNVKEDDSNESYSDSESEMYRQIKRITKKKKRAAPQINLEDYSIPGEETDNEELNESEPESEDGTEFAVMSNFQPLWTLPLYSLLPSREQAKIFESAPQGCRLCVVATNVAETSLTIPNIKYVIDSGKAKMKLYDKVTGVTSYQVMWTSKASANQRAGRAGRTGAGHCYRLYSSAVFNDVFQDFTVPEIQQKPVDHLYLQMKCMNIDKVMNFPFPSAPDMMQLKIAEKRLEIIGALKDGKVTALGKLICQFPVLPRFGKMLALSCQHELLPYTILIVAALSVQEVLLETPIQFSDVQEANAQRQKWAVLRRQWAGIGNSLLLGDPMVLLKAVGAAEYANLENKLEKFCTENGLRHKAVVEIRKLRLQITNEINQVYGTDIIVDPKLKPPTDTQTRLLRQIMLSGMGDQVAKKIDLDEIKEDEDKAKYKHAYRCMDMEEPVFIHSKSVLRKTLPQFVVYQEIYETNKMYMRGVTAIELEWLAKYVPQMCHLSEPLLNPEPRFDANTGKIYCNVNGSFGKQAWTLPDGEIEFIKGVDLYKWYARFLLEGKIFAKLAKYTSNLLSTPSTMVKSWAKLQPRTDAILKALISRDVCSKQALEDIWLLEPHFLLQQYQQWLPESGRNELTLMWPPLD